MTAFETWDEALTARPVVFGTHLAQARVHAMRSLLSMIRVLLSWLVAAVVGLASAAEANAEPGAPQDDASESKRGSPVVVASVLGEGEEVRALVEQQLLEDLEGETLSTLDGEPLVITVTAAADDAATLRIQFRHNDREVYEWTCHCSALELQEQLPGHTKEAFRLARAAAKPAPSPVLAAPSSQAVPDSSTKKRFGQGRVMYGAGVGTTVLGGGIALMGGVMLSVYAADRERPPSWAIAMAAGGAAAAAAGVSLLVVGRRRMRASGVAEVRVLPAGRGLALQGRF